MCFPHYGTTHGSQTEFEEGNMGEMGLTIKVKGGPQLGSRCEGQREKIPESNKAERRRAGEELAGTSILGYERF